MCVCLLLQDLVPITKLFAWGVCVFITAGPSTKLFTWGGCRRGVPFRVCLLLQYLIQSCARGGRRIVEDKVCIPDTHELQSCVATSHMEMNT
jgi:hypothetical protein